MVISDTQVVSTETFYLQEAANQNNLYSFRQKMTKAVYNID